jgi:hypothetical protein
VGRKRGEKVQIRQHSKASQSENLEDHSGEGTKNQTDTTSSFCTICTIFGCGGASWVQIVSVGVGGARARCLGGICRNAEPNEKKKKKRGGKCEHKYETLGDRHQVSEKTYKVVGVEAVVDVPFDCLSENCCDWA